MEARVVVGDLLDQDVEVLVNAWNRNPFPWWLLWPQGVSRAIRRRAGLQPFRELARMPLIPLGGAVLTSAGRLPQRALIHVAGINLLWRASESSIRGSVRSAVQLAQEQGFRSLAFPVLGAGSGGFDPAHALRAMRAELAGLEAELDCTIVQFAGHSR
jgi:O-acetyl-ADP-ribose deacetylase (regulator of RNase III)